MKIGIVKEGKTPPDKRVPLTPIQCLAFKDSFPSIQLIIQSSQIRCFLDSEYSDLGISVVDDLSDCDIILGIKEVPKSDLISNKMYLYFSHTIKGQPYNRGLLQKMLDKEISMVDYEALKHPDGSRIIGFGRYAGIVGCYNGFLAYGKRTSRFDLKAAHLCYDRNELEDQLNKVSLPNIKIILSGNGRVGRGALEIIHKLGIKEVDKESFKNKKFDEPVFVHLDYTDYNARIDGSIFRSKDFFNNPALFKSTFMQYAACSDMFIAGHYYASGSPYLFTREDARSSEFKIRTIADISCDINGPIASSIRASSIANPIYGYNPTTESEDIFNKENVITVMAVDNLPCELPKDASQDFGNALLNSVFPLLLKSDPTKIIDNATICKNGDLNTHFEYLRDYVNGN